MERTGATEHPAEEGRTHFGFFMVKKHYTHLNVKGLSLPNCLRSAQWREQGLGPNITTTERMPLTARQDYVANYTFKLCHAPPVMWDCIKTKWKSLCGFCKVKISSLSEANNTNHKLVRDLISSMCWMRFSHFPIPRVYILQHYPQKSLPNMVRSPYTSRLRTQSEDISVSQEHESFIMDLEPVEENDECWTAQENFTPNLYVKYIF